MFVCRLARNLAEADDFYGRQCANWLTKGIFARRRDLPIMNYTSNQGPWEVRQAEVRARLDRASVLLRARINDREDL
jgi:uncharacterized membrane-anchored protein